MPMHYSLTKRKILSVCIAASLLSHVISLIFLQNRSFWTASLRPLPVASLDKTEPNQILRESFQERTEEAGSESVEAQPSREAVRFMPLPCKIEPVAPPSFPMPSMTLASDVKQELAVVPIRPPIALPPVEPLNLFDHLPKDLIALEPLFPAPAQNLPARIASRQRPLTRPLPIERASPPLISFPHSLLNCPLPDPPGSAQDIRIPELLHLPEFPSLSDLGTSSYSESFDTEIVFAPLENEEGYVFALTLIPHPDLQLPKIRQNYTFLIDRSNSIQKERLIAVKGAIAKALEDLGVDDNFNILAFDSKIDKLSPAPIPATSCAKQAARRFLDEIHLGSFFSTSNLTKPLVMAVPSGSQEDAVHTAILFTDGEPLGKKTAQRELALDWTAYNCGRLALYTIGLGGDPHLATLDAISGFNRGKLLYPPTKRGIKRKLLKLMKGIHFPVAVNMSVTAIPRSPQTKIALYPKPEQMPALYLNEPYVILGTTTRLDNFILFVQGKFQDRWLNIRKTVSFVNAKKGENSLKAEFAVQRAYALYEKYLRDLDPSHLAEARALLDPHDLQAAFQ